jgi:hypothetical protein
LEEKEPIEGALILLADAIAYPRAMVVVAGNTMVALRAVFRPQWLVLLALDAVSLLDVERFFLHLDIDVRCLRRWQLLFHLGHFLRIRVFRTLISEAEMRGVLRFLGFWFRGWHCGFLENRGTNYSINK